MLIYDVLCGVSKMNRFIHLLFIVFLLSHWMTIVIGVTCLA